MSVEIKVPVLPESVPDATMLQWHKSVGDAVKRDENLVDIETDKVVLEVPSPTDGVITSITRQEGDTVVSNEVIAVVEAGAAPTASAEAPAAEPVPAPAAVAAGATSAASVAAFDGPLSPAVRRMVDENNLEPANIAGTGKDGRITKEDVQRHMESGSAANGASNGVAAAAPQPAAREPLPPMPAAVGERVERREPMSRLRQTIARRLVESQQTAALLTTFNEVDMTAVMGLRKQYKESFEKRHGVRLGFMSFFVKAAVEALRQYPAVNAYIEGDEIVYHDYVDVGIAVSSPRGLVVPIVRDTQDKSFARLEQEINDYGARAQEGDLTMDELTGGTFTISNGGVFGSMLSTPIVNPPQSAILGMHNIQQRPVVIDGDIVARPMMYLALSYDHRIVDGRGAVQFLVTIKDALEDPARLLLEV